MYRYLISSFLVMLFLNLNAQVFHCGDSLIDERDGKIYNTVLIGQQCWMAESLNYGNMIQQNGSVLQTNNGIPEKYCYENLESECDEYGGLYEWKEMMQYQTNVSVQGLCPDGWHIPSDEEWMQLEMHLGMSQEDAMETGFERGTNEGLMLQEGGETGFDALYGGIWYPGYGFVYNEDYSSPNGHYFSYFWTSSLGIDNGNYFYRNVNTQFPTITRWQATSDFGYQVRCIADEFSSSYFFEYDQKQYEIVMNRLTWDEAAIDAVSKGGYLVEINDQAEQDTVFSAIINGAQIPNDYVSISNGGGIAYVWIGANDKLNEGEWIWDGDDDESGIYFWTGEGQNGAGDGFPLDGLYNNWGGSSLGEPNEPDNFGGGQHTAAIGLTGWPSGTNLLGSAGEWNDIIQSSELYYIIEYDQPTGLLRSQESSFQLFPNPASEFIQISGLNMKQVRTLRLISITGVQIYEIEKQSFDLFEIDVSYLSKGIYLLKLIGEDQNLIETKKFIVN